MDNKYVLAPCEIPIFTGSELETYHTFTANRIIGLLILIEIILLLPQSTTCADGSQQDVNGIYFTPNLLPPMVSSTPPAPPPTKPALDYNDNPSDRSYPSIPPAPPTQQTSPDGFTPDSSGNCPAPPATQTQTSPDGSVMDVSATCPSTSASDQQQQPPPVDCNANPNDLRSVLGLHFSPT